MEEPDIDTTISTTRVVNAPRELVFRAWTDPQHLQNWWGPKGFTNTFHEFDLRPGGKWKFTMHGPEKGHYQNEVAFIQIEKPSLILWKRISQPLFCVLATFEEISAGDTKVVFNMLFDTPEARDKLKPFVMDKNEENFDRLEIELEKMKSKYQ